MKMGMKSSSEIRGNFTALSGLVFHMWIREMSRSSTCGFIFFSNSYPHFIFRQIIDFINKYIN